MLVLDTYTYECILGTNVGNLIGNCSDFFLLYFPNTLRTSF